MAGNEIFVGAAINNFIIRRIWGADWLRLLLCKICVNGGERKKDLNC